ncbi:Glycoside hydrolase family 16 protein [Venustampulla echinocandica]|uniref:endo-1,3(4)-beta-glucanase n=1 Tax=Venustampulla echinocandica TaxID=2656787 RepID=A0A370TS24_9HELO|nr:Glycoside hydrolase family 16 protein [Venustampulla echinocandica]RDL38303.1 Glycoside hydrolase family 16 protein [Venustampulla echinocandica]
MHASQLVMRLGASAICAAGIANAAYSVKDTFDSTNFFSEFNFFSGDDPTGGFVEYVSAAAANLTSLAGYSNNAVYLGVDHVTSNPAGGRSSVRVTSNNAYTHGLFIADIAHMPGSTCGVWPAFWTFGPNWPSSGEIDIIEGVNDQTTNDITLHTSASCTMSTSGSLGGTKLADPNCNSGNGNNGCGTTTTDTRNYGSGFNAIGGGVYAMDWTSSHISVYFFPRSDIPADITSGKPNPSSWGTPTTTFGGSGCDIDSHFKDHNIVFDTTFCGQWAGQVWDSNQHCKALAPTCNEYVGKNPQAFKDAYWMVNSVKVYQDGSAQKRAEGVIPMPFMA